MRFLSVCSGIEAASVAWNPLGWKAVAFSEIEPFPCELLKQRYPGVPNLGDMNNFREWPHDLAPDLLCGGTPCQSYSNAGLRAGLDDPRGQLMLVFAAIAAKYRPRWLVWENVPGVLSSDGGRDFAQLLGLLTGKRVTPPPGGWQNSGVLAGIDDAYGVAWRCFDAQYAGLAQRRDRVFLVGYLGDWRCAAAVLLERQSLSWNPAPRRGSSQGPAAGTLRSTDGGSDVDHARAQHLVPDVVGALTASDGPNSHGHTGFAGNTPVESGHIIPVQAFGGNNTTGPIDVATACLAHDSFRGDFESDTFITGPAGTLTGGGRKEAGYSTDDMPLLPIGFNARQDPDSWHDRTGPLDVNGASQAMAFKVSHFTRGKDGAPNETTWALTADADKGDQDPVVLAPMSFKPGQSEAAGGAFVTEDFAPTLQAQSNGSTAVPAVAFQERGRKDGRNLEVGGDTAYALTAPADGGRRGEMNVLTPTMAVRRFMPMECERLQGFPDNYTAVIYRGKPAKDGPRYKAIGNSWAIPCVTYIGMRIEQVEAVLRFRTALGGVTSLEL